MALKKHIRFFIMTIVILICMGAFLVYCILFTAQGSKLTAQIVISRYIEAKDINIKAAKGSLAGRLLLQGMEQLKII